MSVTAGVVEPRYPTFKGIIDAKKEVRSSPSDLVSTPPPPADCRGPAPEREAGIKIEDDSEAHLRSWAAPAKKVIEMARFTEEEDAPATVGLGLLTKARSLRHPVVYQPQLRQGAL